MGEKFIVDDPFGEFIPLPAGPTVNADTPFAILENDVRESKLPRSVLSLPDTCPVLGRSLTLRPARISVQSNGGQARRYLS